jgi:hypothetical protein
MALNFKDDFTPNTIISSSLMNENFSNLNNLFHREDLSSQVNGSITLFTTGFNYVSGLILVFYDGLLATPLTDIQETGPNTFTTLFASGPLESGVPLVVVYLQQF